MGQHTAQPPHIVAQQRLRRAVLTYLVSFIAAMGIAIPAHAAGTSAIHEGAALPVRTVTCDAIVVNYHRALTSGDHVNATIDPIGGQVTMYVDQNVPGGSDVGDESGLGLRWKVLGATQSPVPLSADEVASGVVTLPYGAALKRAGVAFWTVSLVQANAVDGYPQLECGEKPPVADATAAAFVIPATCESSTIVDFSISHATWRDPAENAVGTHTRTAVADKGHLFETNDATTAVQYTIEAALPEQSFDEAAPCYVAPEPEPEPESVPTLDPTPGPTVTPEPEPEPTPVYAVFTEPSAVDVCGTVDDRVIVGQSDSGSFSELPATVQPNGDTHHLVVFTPQEGVLVASPHADDHYRIVDGNAVWEFTTTDEPCPPIVIPNNPTYHSTQTCGSLTLTFTNPVSVGVNETTDDAVFTYTDSKGDMQTVVVTAQQEVVRLMTFEEDTIPPTIFVGVKDEPQESISVETDCQPNAIGDPVEPPEPSDQPEQPDMPESPVSPEPSEQLPEIGGDNSADDTVTPPIESEPEKEIAGETPERGVTLAPIVVTEPITALPTPVSTSPLTEQHVVVPLHNGADSPQSPVAPHLPQDELPQTGTDRVLLGGCISALFMIVGGSLIALGYRRELADKALKKE